MNVLFVGGGTLGSVTPLLAVAEHVRTGTEPSAMTFWGTSRGPERQIVEAAGIPFCTIPAGKFRRYVDVRNISDLFVMKWAFWVTLARFVRHRPSVVVGAGSFVQVPVMWAAWFLRIPCVILQLDVRPGLANRLCARIARAIGVTFAASAAAFGRKARVVGAPVRRSVLDARIMDQCEAKRVFGFAGDRQVLLVLGGGTGSQALNHLVVGALPQLTAVADVIHVTGRGTQPERPVLSVERRGSYVAFELLTDRMPTALAAADLVVSRAGMGTIAELGALGKAAVIVPMPDTHQEENAAMLAKLGAVEAWDQRDCTPAVFAERIRVLFDDRSKRQRFSSVFTHIFCTDASSQLADVIREVTAEQTAHVA